MIRTPQLSVIIPIYNAGSYLHEAVLSIQNQTFIDFECLLCDASTDGSSHSLPAFLITDPRFILFRQPGCSLPESLQAGLEQAKAPFIARMDADDISLPQRFALQQSVMRHNPDLVLLGTSYQYIDAQGEKGRVQKLPQHIDINGLMWECPVCHPSVMFRRDAALEAGGYRCAFQRAEDYDLWLRLSSRGKMANLVEVLVLYRMHGTNSVTTSAVATRNYAMKAQALYLLECKGRDTSSRIYESTEKLLAELGTKERLGIQARMLACSAHLTGDEREDPFAAQICSTIKKSLPDNLLSKALALFHMRCIKRYAKHDILRALTHFVQACIYNHAVVLHMILKLTMQYLRKYFPILCL